MSWIVIIWLDIWLTDKSWNTRASPIYQIPHWQHWPCTNPTCWTTLWWTECPAHALDDQHPLTAWCCFGLAFGRFIVGTQYQNCPGSILQPMQSQRWQTTNSSNDNLRPFRLELPLCCSPQGNTSESHAFHTMPLSFSCIVQMAEVLYHRMCRP